MIKVRDVAEVLVANRNKVVPYQDLKLLSGSTDSSTAVPDWLRMHLRSLRLIGADITTVRGQGLVYRGGLDMNDARLGGMEPTKVAQVLAFLQQAEGEVAINDIAKAVYHDARKGYCVSRHLIVLRGKGYKISRGRRGTGVKLL